MAAALDAEWCEICSDVDGVYSADPRVVPAARRIAELSHEETQEMAEAGAKVLNAQAVEFAKQRGIAIYARATAQPPPGVGELSDGTVVRKFAAKPPGTVVGVASEKDVFVLEATDCHGDLFVFLDEQEVCGKQLHLTAFNGPSVSLSMVLSRENLHDEERWRARLAERFCDSVKLYDGLGAVSVIGAGINTSYKNVRHGEAALTHFGIRGVSTSSFRITWLLPLASVDDAVRALHATFIEAVPHPVP
jgi:aspartate kinase